VEVRHGGDPVGEMIVGVAATELSQSERRLLDDLAGPAGLALSTVRMTHSLRERAAEIELTAAQIRASRERMVNARRGEQDRIRDELGTRVRPELDAASRELTKTATLDADALAAAATHVSRAVDELRHLARGLYPARLAEAGPVEALRGWTEVQERQIAISVAGEPARLADPADFAAAIYFCAVTALNGVTGDCSVTFAVGPADVTLEVATDPALNGQLSQVALQAVSDRAEAFGGAAMAEATGIALSGSRAEVAPTAASPASLVRITLPLPAGFPR
jgi:signal transduction histidine kinase